MDAAAVNPFDSVSRAKSGCAINFQGLAALGLSDRLARPGNVKEEPRGLLLRLPHNTYPLRSDSEELERFSTLLLTH
eukprot:1192528-Prorocentrum_minimum.AAC.3